MPKLPASVIVGNFDTESTRTAKAPNIEIKIFVNNPKSRRLAERLGFRQEVVLENYFIDFLTQDIVNGVTYVCCDVKQLPKLNSSIRA